MTFIMVIIVLAVVAILGYWFLFMKKSDGIIDARDPAHSEDTPIIVSKAENSLSDDNDNSASFEGDAAMPGVNVEQEALENNASSFVESPFTPKKNTEKEKKDISAPQVEENSDEEPVSPGAKPDTRDISGV